ncbi:hypothetical protein ACFSGX_07025 [Sphingomonas arantia]|uniref:Uncharacterized protein n=1 Tax=Sphingomonas arantia TaxID=1460676 RepID=A0ABW4TXR8_9SPHN
MSKSSLLVAFAVLASWSATASAASANQFDLVCKGKEQKRTGVPATAWTERFRIDLDAKRWCRGACKTAAQTGQVTADDIVLPDSRATIGGPADAEVSLSRTKGTVREYIMMGWSGSAATLAEGTCTREFFTGFPGQKF